MTLLRYPGSKTLAAKHIISRFPSNIDTYIEPFAGSFSVGLIAKGLGLANKYVLSDFDRGLINFHLAVRDNNADLVDWLNQLVGKSVDTKKYLFNEYKAILKEGNSTYIETAAMYFFVNRCSFSGAGMYGGFSKDAAEHRFTKSSIEKIKRYEDLYQGIEIVNSDYRFVLNDANAFYYLDPPYMLDKGKNTLYKDHNNFDHACLAAAIKGVNALISYNDCDSVRELYADWDIESYNLSYGMANGVVGKELLICKKSPK